MFVDAHSLLCSVDPALAAVTVEARLREEDLTLGLFPERYEVASVGELVEGDDPGAGARGAGFATLLRGTEDGLLLLDVRRRPAAQSGRGLLIESFEAGCEALRILAQTDVVPAISLLADPGRGRPAARGGRRSGRRAGVARRRPGAADPGRRRPAGRGGRPGRARDRRLRLVHQRRPGPERGAGLGGQPLRPAGACRHAGRRRLPAGDVARVASLEPASRRAARCREGRGAAASWCGVSGQGAVLQHRDPAAD